MAAPSFVGAGTGQEITGASGTVTKTGCTVGNLIILQVFLDGGGSYAGSISGVSGIAALDGTASSMTDHGVSIQVGASVAWGRLYFGRATSTSVSVDVNSSSPDIYTRLYEFSGADPSATTVSALIENQGGTGDDYAIESSAGSQATINDVGVTTTGADRLAVNFVAVNDDNVVGAFTGMTGGTWAEAVAAFRASGGTDGCIQLQTATMASAGTINGGSFTMAAADSWGVIGFAILPAAASSTPKSGTDSGSSAEASTQKAVLPRTDASSTSSDTSAERAAYPRTDSGVGSDASFLRQLKAGSDTGSGGAQTSTLHGAYPRTDSGAGADSIKAKASVVTQTGSSTEVSSEHAAHPRTDTGTGTEVSKVTVPVPATQAGSGTDTSQEHAVYALAQPGAGVDASAIQRVYARADTGTGTDSSSVTQGAASKAGSDAGSGVDSSTLHASHARSEAGACNDLASLHASLSRSDAGTCTQTSRLAFKAVDTGHGADASLARALLLVSQPGSALDVAEILFIIGQSADGGIGDDLALVFKGGFLPDRITASVNTSRAGSTVGLNRGGEDSTIVGDREKAEVERWP